MWERGRTKQWRNRGPAQAQQAQHGKLGSEGKLGWVTAHGITTRPQRVLGCTREALFKSLLEV